MDRRSSFLSLILLWLLAVATPANGQVQAMLPSTAQPSSTVPPSSTQPSTVEDFPVMQPQVISEPQPIQFSDDLIGPGCWSWQMLPSGLMYRSYLAGGREPRLGSQWVHDSTGWIWDVALGGRVGILRYGTTDAAWPEGFQIDIEGAAFPRLDLEHERDVVSTDFRAGLPITFRRGPWESKIGYYHLSSHLGDEFMVRFPAAERINYVRETLIAGLALRPVSAVRLYSEVGWAFSNDGGSKPWEFQFGAEYSPIEPSGFRGSPFLAVNTHLREENDFGGNLAVQTGWQWRGLNGQLLRLGLHYFNGKSDQAQFFNTFEELIGLGLWYDY